MMNSQLTTARTAADLSVSVASDAAPQWLAPSRALMQLQKHRQQAQVQSAPAPVELHPWIALPLGELGLLLPALWPKALLDESPVCEVPFAPPWLDGFVNLRSQPVPVIDLMRYFNLDPARPTLPVDGEDAGRHGRRSRYLLRLGEGHSAFAVRVEAFPRKLALGTRELMDRPVELPPRLQQCAGGLFYRDRLWVEWDLKRFCQQLVASVAS